MAIRFSLHRIRRPPLNGSPLTSLGRLQALTSCHRQIDDTVDCIMNDRFSASTKPIHWLQVAVLVEERSGPMV